MTVDVEIYSTPFCPYCVRAKQLLADKGAAFRDVDVMGDPERRMEMVKRAGGKRTVPQIFINGRHVGDCDALFALERRGALDALLAEEP